MEKQGVPMNQYPQTPDLAHQQTGGQPPVYQDANQPQYGQQTQMYQQAGQPTYAGSPAPGQQQGYMSPQQTGQPQYKQDPSNPGMPPQQTSTRAVFQNATPIASLNRGPAPADCPACGLRGMTNISYEIGNSTHAWALGLCCLTCLGCIPYVMNSLKDVQHKCGLCGVLLATWHRSGTTEVHIHN